MDINKTMKYLMVVAKFAIGGLVTVLLFAGTPILLNWIMGYPNKSLTILDNDTQKTWLNFYGSFLGGIVGSIVTVIASALIASKIDELKDKKTLKNKYTTNIYDSFAKLRSDEILFTTNIYKTFQMIFLENDLSPEIKKELDDLRKNLIERFEEFQHFYNTNLVMLRDDKEHLDKAYNALADCVHEVGKCTLESTRGLLVQYFNQNCCTRLNTLRSAYEALYIRLNNKYMDGIIQKINETYGYIFEPINIQSIDKIHKLFDRKVGK